MNKYFLMLGVATVALGSYCAYATNSATMTVTATIAHDVSLSVGQPLSFGTVTINPSIAEGNIAVGIVQATFDGGVLSITDDQYGTIVGTFPASGFSFTKEIVTPFAAPVSWHNENDPRVHTAECTATTCPVEGRIKYESVPAEATYTSTVRFTYTPS
ncbi:MAG: hypothetical protein IJ689_00995 [Alphaproteobacteria bacterium]|nr:hypothetical protein [Alphaproteobacteria bacterium]